MLGDFLDHLVYFMEALMFAGFANVWTPIERASRVKRQPLSLVVAGERIVLFRDAGAGAGAGDRLVALIDRCPHRGVALSLGKVTPEGTLACPFHGWQFDGCGACVRVPLLPEARCERLSATALPVREIGELVWLYTGPQPLGQSGQAGPGDAGEPQPPEALVDPAFRRYILIKHWRAHWTRAMENMLDMPHVPFVHRRTIGFAMRRRMRPDSRLAVTWEPTALGGMIRGSLDGAPPPSSLEFRRPNNMTLTIPIPGRRMRIHVFCVPVGPAETRTSVARPTASTTEPLPAAAARG
jgi:phenylpropionate dioxygenase-like ring-hydroxylating dioxygenase large terminal subunit